MASNLTKSQNNAIESTGCTLVSAAAGSGKTRVLTERVIKKLTGTNPVSADKLLIVTFTNAAALEMRTRIENALLEKISENPADNNLIKQYHLLDSADISTIDSFCINLVRENFEKCGVEQNFSVTNGADMSEICDAILSLIIDEQFQNKSPEFRLLLSLLDCEKDDENLREIIKSLYRYSNTVPFPEIYFNNLKTPYISEFNIGHVWFEAAFDYAGEVISDAQALISEIKNVLPYLSEGNSKFVDEVERYEILFENLKSLIILKDWDKAVDTVFSDFPKAESVSQKFQFADKYKYCREELKNSVLSLRTYFVMSQKETNEYLKKYSPAVTLLTELVKDYSDKILDAFKENNVLAFYHTEQMALSLLCDINEDGIIVKKSDADCYIEKYDEIMVDEYQDVNDLQELMFKILSDDQKKLFVVGDVKQSIYRFRGSNPKNFLKKKNDFIPFSNAGDNDKKKIILAENFRSRNCVCDFVNFIFEKIMTVETGGIDYGNEEVLNAAADYQISDDEFTDLILIDNSSDSEDDYEIESNAIAQYILDLISSKKQIKREGGTSGVTFGDICVLFESTTKAPILAKTLTNRGIPVSYYGEDFCKSPEISMILSLLTIIENPLSNVDLLTVLMSPLFSFTPDDIAIVRLNCPQPELYRAVLSAANAGNDKCKNFIERLEFLMKKSVVMSITRFVSYIVYETELFSIISSLENSKIRKKNIYQLINFAKNYSGGSVNGFVDYIRSLPNDSFVTADNEGNSVKIMTMHKSKGLQFPICILSNLSKKFFSKDREGAFVLSEKFGPAFKPFDEEKYAYTENIGYELVKNEIKEENLSEKIRLLYVAMTRAEEKLVLVISNNKSASIKSTAKALASGCIPSRELKKSQSLSKLLLCACLFHPDANILREIAGYNVPKTDTKSRMNVYLYNSGDSISDTNSEKTDTTGYNEDFVDRIKENIAFKYKNEFLSKISAKTSVSELTHNNDNAEYLFSDRPAFMNENGISPTQKGTAIHKIMQFLDFNENIDIDAEIERLVEWQFITQKEGEIADRKKLLDFFSSSLYDRILNSEKTYKEMRFLTEINAGEIDDVPDELYDQKVIVQGAVDLLFFENNEIVIVDFKTDRVKDESILKDLYGEQLNLYASACSKKFGKRIREKIIYSFHLSKEIKLSS